MQNQVFSQSHFLNGGLAPVADALAGTVTGDYVTTKLYSHVTFVLIRGVGATGTSTLTVQAASDNTGTGATAIPFKSRSGTLAGVLGALTTRAAAGYTTSAGSNQIDVIEVDAADTPDGKPFVALKAVEVVDSPVAAAVLTILSKARFEQAILADPT